MTRIILRRFWRPCQETRGLSLVEIALVLVVLAIVGSILYVYLGSTSKTLATLKQERPLSQARLTADRSTRFRMAHIAWRARLLS